MKPRLKFREELTAFMAPFPLRDAATMRGVHSLNRCQSLTLASEPTSLCTRAVSSQVTLQFAYSTSIQFNKGEILPLVTPSTLSTRLLIRSDWFLKPRKEHSEETT